MRSWRPGDDTQTFLKIPLPTLKSSWRSNGMLADGCEKMSRLSALNTVVGAAGPAFVALGLGEIGGGPGHGGDACPLTVGFRPRTR